MKVILVKPLPTDCDTNRVFNTLYSVGTVFNATRNKGGTVSYLPTVRINGYNQMPIFQEEQYCFRIVENESNTD